MLRSFKVGITVIRFLLFEIFVFFSDKKTLFSISRVDAICHWGESADARNGANCERQVIIHMATLRIEQAFYKKKKKKVIIHHRGTVTSRMEKIMNLIFSLWDTV